MGSIDCLPMAIDYIVITLVNPVVRIVVLKGDENPMKTTPSPSPCSAPVAHVTMSTIIWENVAVPCMEIVEPIYCFSDPFACQHLTL